MIGETLKELREAKKLSRQEAAEKMGIQKRTLESYEYNKREPNIQMINKLADFYEVSTDYLLGRKTKEEKEEKFIQIYSKLPKETKKIFIDTMKKLFSEN